MADVHYMKQGTTKPTLVRTITDEDGLPVDLTGAQSVKFTMASVPGKPKVSAANAAVVGDATEGTVEYTWQAADMDRAGDYSGYFLAVLANGDVVSYPPKDDYILVRVGSDLLAEVPAP